MYLFNRNNSLLLEGRDRMKEMVILHIAGLTFKKSSGLTTSVPALIDAQNKINNIKSGLVLSIGKSSSNWSPNFDVFEYNKDFYDASLEDLPSPYNNPDLVVFHSTYIPIHAKFANKIHKRKIPYIIVPRGGMTQGSQNIKKHKKILGNILFYNKMVKNALAIHCLTKGELIDSKFWNKRMFIVGNGINLPKYNNIRKTNPKGLKFVFIGRLDIYHKGLDILIEACSKVYNNLKNNNCVIEIYGPNQRGSIKTLNSLIMNNNLEDIVKVLPPVYDKEKSKILRDADVFIHTSRFEGMPMSVLEALSHGIPCFLTPGTNISTEVENAGAGWEVRFSSKDIAQGLKEILNNKNKLKDMSLKAYQLVERNFTWESVAKETISNYKLLLNQ